MFTDPLDHAAMLQDVHNTEALRKQRASAPPMQTRNEDGTWPETECRECDEPIEPQRLEHGFVRCIRCQTKIENRKRYFR